MGGLPCSLKLFSSDRCRRRNRTGNLFVFLLEASTDVECGKSDAEFFFFSLPPSRQLNSCSGADPDFSRRKLNESTVNIHYKLFGDVIDFNDLGIRPGTEGKQQKLNDEVATQKTTRTHEFVSERRGSSAR